MTLQSAFHRALEECDIDGVRVMWSHIAPHLHQPQTDAEALATIHLARTGMELMPFNKRAYSHRWCLDHGIPSQLPDHLKPRAERIYPIVQEAVGISVSARNPDLKPVAQAIAECDGRRGQRHLLAQQASRCEAGAHAHVRRQGQDPAQAPGLIMANKRYAPAVDNGLSYVKTNATAIHLLPAGTYADRTAILAASLGHKTVSAGGIFPAAIAAATPNGRKLTTLAVSDGIVTANGTVAHWAIIASTANGAVANAALLIGDMTTPLAITTGVPWTLAAFPVAFPASV